MRKILKVLFVIEKNQIRFIRRDCRFHTKMATQQIDPNEYYKARVAAVNELRAQGVAYPHKFQTTISVGGFIEKYGDLDSGVHLEDETVQIAGRISRIASSSAKLRFLDLKSNGFKIQVFANAANHNESTGDFNEIYNSLRRGDIVGIVGFPGKSKRGELSVFPRSLQVLSPCLHMLPDKAGLKDIEVRFRQRYLDFIVNDDNIKVMQTRSQICSFVRRFLTDMGFIEVETATMNPTLGGASARPFITHHNDLDIDLFMRVAPELPLKMIIIGGFEKVFEIGKCFRNEAIDLTHNPEFTTVEFYWAYADYNDLMAATEKLLSEMCLELHGTYQIPYHPQGPQGPTVMLDFEPPFNRVSLVDELENKIGFKLEPPYDSPACIEKYKEAILSAGLALPTPATPAKLIDQVNYMCGESTVQLVGHYIEDAVEGKPTFLLDFPKCMCPLAKWHRAKENICERFELFLCGKELINAYTELNDPHVQRQALRMQEKDKAMGDDEATCVDESFCVAMEYGLPPTGGWGMGIDRLTMFMTDRCNIKVNFPRSLA